MAVPRHDCTKDRSTNSKTEKLTESLVNSNLFTYQEYLKTYRRQKLCQLTEIAKVGRDGLAKA